jgi:6-pyruvoyl-tetrahydropterin synthase
METADNYITIDGLKSPVDFLQKETAQNFKNIIIREYLKLRGINQQTHSEINRELNTYKEYVFSSVNLSQESFIVNVNIIEGPTKEIGQIYIVNWQHTDCLEIIGNL